MRVLDGSKSSIISIHALLAESDKGTCNLLDAHRVFLSTLSLRRATRNGFAILWNTCISIHALLAESDTSSTVIVILSKNFYPRSPCGERQWEGMKSLSEVEFLSTLSLRRATANSRKERQGQHISIHALLAESDRGRHIIKTRT